VDHRLLTAYNTKTKTPPNGEFHCGTHHWVNRIQVHSPHEMTTHVNRQQRGSQQQTLAPANTLKAPLQQQTTQGKHDTHTRVIQAYTSQPRLQ